MNLKPVPKTEPRPRRARTDSPATPVPPALPHLTAPAWASQWAGERPCVKVAGDFSLAVSEGDGASLVSVRLPGARLLEAPAFERQTIAAYRLIHSTVKGLRHGHPVRFWNFLPGIHQMLEPGPEGAAGDWTPLPPRDRYMVFNAGRFAALSDWFGGPGRLPGSLPAASAVGHDGDDFAVHCLLLSRPGVAVENPRQVPAFRYSARYGPKPPCFARATIVPDPRDGAPTLLAAGTASILGEQSVHVGDLPAQLAETLSNLRALLGAALRRSSLCPAAEAPAGEGACTIDDDTLRAFTAVRVYHLRPPDAAEIDAGVRAAFPAARVETVQAELCRADLLVEIEGVARLAGTPAVQGLPETHERKGG